MNTGSPEQKRRVNDSPTGRHWRLCISLSLAKKRHPSSVKAAGWTRNGIKEKKPCQDTCTTTILRGDGRTLEQPIDKGGCNGLRSRKFERTIGPHFAGTQEMSSISGVEAEALESDPADLLKTLVFQGGGAQLSHKQDWIQHQTRRKSMQFLSDHENTSSFHFSPSCMLRNTHQLHGTDRNELSFPRRRQLSVGLW